MKGCLDKLIHLLQSSFVPGRHATDDILIAQDLTHSIRKSTAKNEGLMVKLDLEKAYDRVSWEFLMDTLRLFGFLERTMQLIGSVYPELLSLCWGMERLSMPIQRVVGDGCWTPFPVCRNGPCIPNLFFADDLLLFVKTNSKQARVVKDVERFCCAAGQHISVAKSIAFASPRVPMHVRQEITRITGIHFEEDLGKYLRVPFLQVRCTRQTFGYLCK